MRTTKFPSLSQYYAQKHVREKNKEGELMTKKKLCRACNHIHRWSGGRGKKGRGKTTGMQCMKKGCKCPGFKATW